MIVSANKMSCPSVLLCSANLDFYSPTCVTCLLCLLQRASPMSCLFNVDVTNPVGNAIYSLSPGTFTVVNEQSNVYKWGGGYCVCMSLTRVGVDSLFR